MPNWFDRFTQSVWGSSGNLDDPTPAQAAAGWSYIGQAPPTVEQFNSVEQWSDQKDNWLYNQLANVITASGGTPSDTDLNGLLKAVQLLGRKRLTADLNLYVSPTGNDTTGDGLTTGTAWATMQHAWNTIINNYDLSGHNITVNVAAGTYTSGIVAQGVPIGFNSGTRVLFTGDTVTPGNCNLSLNNQHCFTANAGAHFQIQGFAMSAAGLVSGTNASLLVVGPDSQITIPGNTLFGGCPGNQLWSTGGTITLASSYAINGNGQAHFSVTGNGNILYSGSGYTTTLTGGPIYSTAFAAAFGGGMIEVFTTNVTYTGAATGPHYNSQMNGIIWTNSAGPTFFPGTVAGVVGTGGQYA